MNLLERLNRDGSKIYFYFDFGRGKGQRPSTDVFIYTKPKDQIERNHNKEAKAILDSLKSRKTLEQQAIGTGYIPQHKFKNNFLDYYADYVKLNSRTGKRRLKCSFDKLKTSLALRRSGVKRCTWPDAYNTTGSVLPPAMHNLQQMECIVTKYSPLYLSSKIVDKLISNTKNEKAASKLLLRQPLLR